MNTVSTLVLLAGLVVLAHSLPSQNQWHVPCSGYVEAKEVICGGTTATAAATRTRRDTKELSADNSKSRQKRNAGSRDFYCDFDYPICSLGLKEALCDGNCELDYTYHYSGDTLYVDAPCQGLFTVVLCIEK